MSGVLTVDLMAAFTPYTEQARVLQCRARNILFIGGVGCGKTTTGAMFAILKAFSEPNTHGLVAGRTEQNDAVKLMWGRIRELLTKMSEQTGINFIRRFDGRSNMVTLINGSTMTFRGFAQPERLLGPDYAWIWADEMSQAGASVDPKRVWDLLTTRLRGVAGKNKQFLVTMTARGLDEIATLFQAKQRERDGKFYVVKATSYANPHIPREDIDAMVASLSKRRVKQEIYCILVKPEAAVWPEFSLATHLIDVKRSEFRKWQHVAACDWGATRGNVMLEIRVHPDTKQWVVVDELILRSSDFKDGQVNRQRFRAAIKKWWSDPKRGYPAIVVSDRAIVSENGWLRSLCAKHSPSTSVTTLVTKQEQLRHNGYEMIRDALDPSSQARPRLLFANTLDRTSDPETPGILASMASLAWATTRGGKPMGFVMDSSVYRDSTDALRMAWVGCRNRRDLHHTLPRFIGVGSVEDVAA